MQRLTLHNSFIQVNLRYWYRKGGNIKASLKAIKLLRDKAGMSPLLLTRIYEDQHWSKMGDACFIRQGDTREAKVFGW